jgi:hypothetical protein
VLDPLQPFACERQRLVVRKEAQTQLTGRNHCACGQSSVAALRSMVCEVRSALGIERCVLLEQFRNAPMHGAPARQRNGSIDAACDQVVREAEAALSRQQHSVARRSVQRFSDRVPIQSGHPP